MKEVDVQKAQRLFDKERPGEFEVLDVRQEWEYSELHLPGARLIALGELADRVDELDPDRPVIVYCRTGARSAAAGRFLEGAGFREVSNLSGGILAWQGVVAEGDEQRGMIHFPDIEELGDVFLFGYGMETALESFYAQLAHQAEDSAVEELFTTLAGYEDKHKRMVHALYRKATGDDGAEADFAARAVAAALEGGIEPEEMASFVAGLEADRQAVFELAMSIEAQALDFYMRCSRRTEDRNSELAFRQLAREEQGHLRLLAGRLQESA